MKETLFIFSGVALTYYLLRKKIWEGPEKEFINKNKI